MPFPRDYLIGFDSQLFDQQVGLFGNLQAGELVPYSYWYDPLRTLAYKVPIGTLTLGGAALIYWIRQSSRRRFPDPILVAIPLLLVGLLCAQGGNIRSAFRYSLPALPFIFILLARPCQVALRSRLGCAAVMACLLWNAVSLARCHPSYLAYGNEIVGGHAGAQQTFLGSNFDWGQDLLFLKDWSDRHPELGPLAVTYYGPMHPAEVGLKTRPLPSRFEQSDIPPDDEPPDGFYWVISSNVLHGLPGLLEVDGSSSVEGLIESTYISEDKAVARVGESLYVFRVHADEETGHPEHLTIEGLAGCVKHIEPGDLIGAP